MRIPADISLRINRLPRLTIIQEYLLLYINNNRQARAPMNRLGVAITFLIARATIPHIKSVSESPRSSPASVQALHPGRQA